MIPLHELEFDRPLTQAEVSVLLGVSPRRIQQLERRALQKLRSGLERLCPSFMCDPEWNDTRWADRNVA